MANTAHKPTDSSRAEVTALASFGIRQDDIAKYIGIDATTLDKYYRREIDTAEIKANAQVANKLFHKAVYENDLSAQIFWLKTRARWRTADKEEPQRIALTIDHEDALKALE